MPDHRRHSAWSARHLVSRLQLLQLAVVVAAGAAVLLIATSSVQSATVDVARGTLAAAPGAAGGVTVAGADVPQTSGVADLLREEMRPADVDVVSSVRADGVAAAVGGAPTRLDLVADDTLQDGAVLSAGAWPGPGETALEEHAAAALGVAVGAVLNLGSEARSVTVSGLWHAADPLAQRWAGHPAPTSGRDGDRLGPALLSLDDLRGVTSTRTAEWTIVPRAGTTSLAGIGVLADRADPKQLAQNMAAAVSDLPAPPTASGGLAEIATTALRAAEGVRALAAIPLLLLLLLVVFGVARLWSLVAETLSPTDALVRSRGAGASLFRRWNGLDALLVGGSGLLAGAGVALIVLGGDIASSSPFGAVGALVPVAALAVAAVGTGSPQTPAPAVRLVILLVLALAAALGVIVLWTDRQGLDALGTVALPAAVLTLILAALAAASRGVQTLRSRSTSSLTTSTTAFLTTAGLAARVRSYTSTALVVALAASLSVVAASLEATAPQAAAAATASRTGVDARFAVAVGSIVTPGSPPLAAMVPALLNGSGGAASAPGTASASDTASASPTGAAVLSTSATVGADTFALLGLPAADAPTLLGSGLVADRAPTLPAGSTRLSVTIAATDVERPGRLTATAWVAGAAGALAALSFDGSLDLATGGETTLTAELPDGVADVSVLAVDIALQDSPEGGTVTTAVTGIRAEDDEGGTTSEIDPARLNGSDPVLSVTRRTVRTLVDAPAGPVMVTLDQAGAGRLGASVGDHLGFALPTGRTLDAEVAGVVPVLPGTQGAQAMALDLTALARASLAASDTVAQPDELWVSTSRPDEVAAEFARTTDHDWSVGLGSPSRSAAAVAPATAVALVSAAAAVLMAALTLWSTLALLRRRSLGRALVLSTLGLARKTDGAAARFELGAVVLVSALIGAMAGLVGAALTVPIATATALGAPISLNPLAFDPLVAAAGIGALTLVLAASVLLAGRPPATSPSRTEGRRR